MGIGKSICRQDALEKVTGTAKFTEDLIPQGALVAKVLHSTIANGVVRKIDITKAAELPGVEKVLTCFDVPQRRYATVAHPLSLDPAHAEVEDHLMLTARVRHYGDDIAVVVAQNELAAKRALKLIDVEYESYEPALSVDQALDMGGVPIHEECKGNVLKNLSYCVKDGKVETWDEAETAAMRQDAFFKNPKSGDVLQGEYKSQMVQHAHIENITSFAYMEGRRVVVVTTTQAPHVLRRIISEATGISLGDIRVIKPYIGGAFGNKQEVLYEPLLAYLTRMLGGRCISIVLSREETFVNSRVRHAFDMRMLSDIVEGEYFAQSLEIKSNKGAYGSHGHAVPAHAITNFSHIYHADVLFGEAKSIFTNLPSGAAMRGYGIPQITFAIESQMDVLANKLGLDPIALRKKYMMKNGYADVFDPVICQSNELPRCIDKGMELMEWTKKRKEYSEHNKGDIRRGVGMGIFCYKSCVFPHILENAGCRIVLNQNGSVQVQVGATEIGQGSDTVFSQMVSQELTIPEERIHVISTQDTDVTPYDPGSYASRQSYVTGRAVKEAAQVLKAKILAHAAKMSAISEDRLDLQAGNIVHNGTVVYTIGEVASHSLYNTDASMHLTAETTQTCKNNAFSVGACFADVEIDIPVGKLTVKKLISVHDSGTIMNPKMATAQIHGGVAMAFGQALGEVMLFDQKTGKPLNNNFLDYKIPTAMDVPPIEAVLIDGMEPTGPFGNKGLGEPPIIPPAAAIRNALYHATGLAINEMPFSPQKLVEAFMKAGFIGGIN